MSPTPAKMNPFPGLRPFTQEEDYLFFGREEQTIELLQRLGSNRFVAVVGSSGSGKSSLVRCGLLSELLGGKMLGAGAAWEIAVTHPGGNPLALLTEALLEADLYDRKEENARENLLATLSRSHFGLVEAVKQADLGEETNFLLVVDQFEEIFRFHEAGQTQQEVANEFVSLLLEAAAQKEVPIYVVLTMRSDFIGECGQFEGLAEKVNHGEFLIPRLTREQYKRVIEGPIKVAGGQIAPRLLQRLLNDLGQQADQLPCLQHALMRTWDVWTQQADSEALDLDDYQRVGKMSQALSLHADEIYESLADDRQRELCKGIFQALTVEESNSRGIRRPQRLGRLCQILEVLPGELLPIIDAFRQQHVTFLMPSPEVQLTEQTIIDISHESLMRVWTRLRQWVEEETQAAGIYHRLSESADLHEHAKAGLYRDPELGIALAWKESKRPNVAWAERYRPGFATAMMFLETSRQASVEEEQTREVVRKRELEQAQQLAEAQQLRLEQQHRAGLKLRKMIGGLAIVAVIAGLACVAALFANQRANRLAQDARQNEEAAVKSASRAELSEQQAVNALAQVESQKADVERSLTKAEKAEQIARTAEEAGRKLLYTTDMRLAPFVWRDDRTTAEQLRVLLAKHIPDRQTAGNDTIAADEKSDLRGFEWYYDQHLLEQSATVFSGHAEPVEAGVFASNGQLVTLDLNGQVRYWDMESQDEVEANRSDLPGGPTAQLRVLSPNGRLAALADGDKIRVFDTSTGKESFQFNSANTGIRQLAFSREGDRLVVVDGKIQWYSTVSGTLIASQSEKFGRIGSVTLSSDGLTIAVVGIGQTGTMFSTFHLDAAENKVTPLAKEVKFAGTLEAGAFSPDGRLIAVGAKLAGSMYVSDSATGRRIAQHGSAHASPITALTFSGDGARLASADSEGTIKIWTEIQKLNSRSAALLILKGHQGAILSVAFSSDGKWLLTTGADKTVRIWDLNDDGAAIRSLESTTTEGSFITRCSPDGLLIASADGISGSIRLWDAATGRLVRELPADNQGRVRSVAFSPVDNRLLAVGHGDKPDISHVSLWDIDGGTELARLPGATDLPDFRVNEYSGVIDALAFSPDGKSLVAGFGSRGMLMGMASPNPLKVWDVATRQLIRRLEGHTGYCISIDFSADGKLLASCSRDGTAILWSTETWKATRTIQNPDKDSLYKSGRPGMYDGVALSPDAKLLALASREGAVQLWDVASGNLLESLQGHSSAVMSVVFSPDGRTLVSGGGDQTVRLWNVATRRELMQLNTGGAELGEAASLAFSPDGNHLLAGGDGAAFWSTVPIVWNNPEQAAEKLRLLLQTKADFQSRIRMLSENLRLHAALEKLDSQVARRKPKLLMQTTDVPHLEKLDSQEASRIPVTLSASPEAPARRDADTGAREVRVAAALAATQANWYASGQAWPEAALAYDRLLAADQSRPEAWLRTPGLLRLATALVHQDRPGDAVVLLSGGAKRRADDGLPAAENRVAVGLLFSTDDGEARVKEVFPGSPAARSALRAGDVILKVNEIELTGTSVNKLSESLKGEAGTKVRLTVRHVGNDRPEVIEVTREKFLNDKATGELLQPLWLAINERLASNAQNAGLLELRAEVAGQWSDSNSQVADYTAAIEILSRQNPEPTADLQRLYGRRGHAHVALRQWQPAVDDYARVVTDATTDEPLLSNQALAEAEVRLASYAARWTVLNPTGMESGKGATLTRQEDGSILASGINIEGDAYKISAASPLNHVAAVRLEVLPDASLPKNGPGRHETGNFHLRAFRLYQSPREGQMELSPVPIARAWASYEWKATDEDVAGTIDETLNKDWHVWGRLGEAHQAAFILREPAVGTDQSFVIELRTSLNLGRFRLSVSDDPDAFTHEESPAAAMKLTDPWQKLAVAYRIQGDQQAIDQLVKRHPIFAGRIGDVFVKGEKHDWQRAVEIYSRGMSSDANDSELLSKRARAYEGLKNWAAAAADWTRAAAGNRDEARLLADFARRTAIAGQTAIAKEQIEKPQAMYEKSLQADPGNNVVAADLAQLLLDKLTFNEPQWVTLKPADAETDSEKKLTPQDDDSILVETTPEIVRWQTYPQPVQALRIETSTHAFTPATGAPFFNEYQIVTVKGELGQSGVLRGRFVRLDLPGENSQFPRYAQDGDKKTINLAEFQVFQRDQNIAQRKKATQSSDRWEPQLVAAGAVDGHTDGKDGGNPYAHTAIEQNPWWEVDLGSEQAIDRMVVWNRNEAPYFARMNHFRIRVLDQSRKVVFEQVIDKAPSPSTEIVPQPLIVELKSATTGNEQPLNVRLPISPQKDAPARFRVSVASSLVDLGLEEKSKVVLGIADVETRLAVAYAQNRRNDESLAHFNKALEQDKSFESRKQIIKSVVPFDDLVSTLFLQHPDDPQWQLAMARKLAETGKQHLADKQLAKAQADLHWSREIFANFRANVPEINWMILSPTEMSSAGGATLALQADRSIFASGTNPAFDTYTIKAPIPDGEITALRLETIPDDRLPNKGAGRTGDFLLREFEAALTSPAVRERKLIIKDGFADLSPRGPIAYAFDGNELSFWDTFQRSSEPHSAVFVLETPVSTQSDSQNLVIRVKSGVRAWPRNNLGRFRLSATSDAHPLELTHLHHEFKIGEVVDVLIALAKVYIQLGQTNEAVAALTDAVPLATDHSSKALIIAAAARQEGALDQLARRATDDRLFQAELARHYAEQGNAPLAEANRVKARDLFEKELSKEPENSVLAAELAELLLQTTRWTVLKPTEMNSKGGATLSVLSDDSILASGKVPKDEVYAITLPVPTATTIQSIRLEALAHDSLRDRGPGRAERGIFAMVDWEVTATGPNATAPHPLTFQRVAASFAWTESPATVSGHWNISGWGIPGWKAGQDYAAVWSLAQPIPLQAGSTLHFQMTFNKGEWSDQILGRFRLSVSDDPAAFGREQRRFAALKFSDPWAKLVAAYFVIDDPSAVEHLLKRHPSAASGIGDVFVAERDWEQAVTWYSKAITPDAKDADLFAKRAEACEKLEFWQQAIADWGKADELVLDRNKRYAGEPCIVRRAKLYERIGKYDLALADFTRAIDIPNIETDPLTWRALFHARQNRWKLAASDYRLVWKRRQQGWYVEWYFSRDRALMNLLAGDMDGYREAAAEMLARTEKLVDSDSSHWLLTILCLAPDMITDANRDRLMAASDRVTDTYWKPRLKAALLFRSGKFQQAAELFEQNKGGYGLEFMLAMAHQELGHPERYNEYLNNGNTWVQQQRDKDPGSILPLGIDWYTWAICLQFQREADLKAVAPQLADLDARVKLDSQNAVFRMERARLLAKFNLFEDALVDLDKIVQPPTNPSEYFGLRGRILASVNRIDEALLDLNRAVESGSADILDYAARGRLLLSQGKNDLARSDLEKSLAIEPTEQAAKILADMLLGGTLSDWTVLNPIELKSTGGAKLTRQDDGSILASGVNPDRDDYTLVARPDLERITAIRLEAMTDPSLPSNGPGRSGNGNFHLNELRVFSGGQPCALTGIRVAFDEGNSASIAIDGKTDEAMGWGNYPMSGVPNTALVTTSLQRGPQDDLKIEMRFSRSVWKLHNLGRFRVSVTGDASVIDREHTRLTAIKQTDPWLKLAAAYALNGRHVESAQQFERALSKANDYEARKPILELAARFGDVLFTLSQQHPQDQQFQLAVARKLMERGNQHLAAKQLAEAQADLKKSRQIFARLRAKDPTQWTVLTPSKTNAKSGVTLTVQDDQSILASAKYTVKDVYTVDFRAVPQAVRVIRLEALRDASLPNGGPGTHGGGNFVLSDFHVLHYDQAQPSGLVPIPLRSAMATFEERPARKSLEVGESGWSINGGQHQSPTAFFEVEPESGTTGSNRLRVVFEFYHEPADGQPATLGRFRVSVSSDDHAFETASLSRDLKEREFVEVNLALARAHVQQGHINEAAALLTAALDLSPDRDGIAAIIAEAAPREGVLHKLSAEAANNPYFQSALARHLADDGKSTLAESAGAKARALFEEMLLKQPDDTAVALELAELLVDPIDQATKLLVPTSQDESVNWRYTTTQPPADWIEQTFNDSAWANGLGPFGKDSLPNVQFRTPWTTSDIWLRRTFDWKSNPTMKTLLLKALHDDGFELFINGKQVYRRQDFNLAYRFYTLDANALELLKPGGNTLAVHCNTWAGGQHIDVGLHAVSSSPELTELRLAGSNSGDPWAKLAAAYHLLGDQPGLHGILASRPSAASGIGDLYAFKHDWPRAIAEYDRAITSETRDARIFAARAEAHEKLEHWELAAADWGNADLHAIDKQVRYGNPLWVPLEHRANLYGRLQQYDKQVQDFTELLKPGRTGDNQWIFRARAEAYDHLRQWDKALADYDRMITVCPPSERAQFQFFRGIHFAAQAQWNQAADELRPIYQNPIEANKDWSRVRDASLIFAMARDEANYRKTAMECYRKAPITNLKDYDYGWTVLTWLQLPETITDETRPQLLELAAKSNEFWQPRLKAAIEFRTGEYEKAAEFFDTNHPGQQCLFLASMVYQKLGKHERARQLLDEGYAWLREQRAKDPGAGVPRQYYSWQDWVVDVGLQSEAADMILGPIASEPKKLALQGQLAEAANAYAKAIADAPDEISKSRIIDDLVQFESVVTALHRQLPNEKPIQEAYRRKVQNTAAEFSRKLDSLNGTSSEDQAARSELISSIIRRQDDVSKSLLKLRPDDTLLQAGNCVLVGDWKNAAAHYSKLKNDKADSIAQMGPISLSAYAGDLGQHRVECQKMYEQFRDSTSLAEIERTLKMMLLVDNGPELPPEAVKQFYDSFSGELPFRTWFLATRALLECRKGNHAEAHERINESLALDNKSPNVWLKAMALAVRSLIYAKQKDAANARKTLEQVKQIMSEDLKMNWIANGLDGSTILNGLTVEHDKLIPEIIRREAEQLVQSAAESSPPKPPAK